MWKSFIKHKHFVKLQLCFLQCSRFYTLWNLEHYIYIYNLLTFSLCFTLNLWSLGSLLAPVTGRWRFTGGVDVDSPPSVNQHDWPVTEVSLVLSCLGNINIATLVSRVIENITMAALDRRVLQQWSVHYLLLENLLHSFSVFSSYFLITYL